MFRRQGLAARCARCNGAAMNLGTPWGRVINSPPPSFPLPAVRGLGPDDRDRFTYSISLTIFTKKFKNHSTMVAVPLFIINLLGKVPRYLN